MFDKEFLGFLSIACAIIGPSGYLWSIYKKRTKPHAFSWIIWGVILSIVFFAQLDKGGGAGAWITGFSAVIQFIIATLAILYGEKNITKGDWLAFTGAFAIIPIWYFTQDPLWAVILATTIDVLAYYPTFRKSYLKPYEENYFIYLADTVKWIPALFAMNNYSIVTVLYPICILVANGSTAAMILWRRRVR